MNKDKLIQYLTTPEMWDSEPDCIWTPHVYQVLLYKVRNGEFDD